MPASVPTAAEFDALAARVAKLEGAAPGPGPGPTPGQPSATGHYITKPADPAILDDALNAWTLVASGGQQIAVQRVGTQPPPMIDAVTANVTKLGVDLVGGARRIVQQNQTGNWYASSAPFTPWSAITGPDGWLPPPAPAGQYYHVAAGKLVAPDGSAFRARGLNASMLNWPDNSNIVMHSAATLKACWPGMNFVRVPCAMSMKQLQWVAPAAIAPYVDDLINNGIIVMLEYHEYSSGGDVVLTGGNLDAVCNWYAAMASHYKGNANVWFATQNEPYFGSGNIPNMMNRIHDAVRGTGNGTPVVLCPHGGSNQTYVGFPSNSCANMSNVAGDLHCYSWIAQGATMAQAVQRSFDALQVCHTKDGVMPCFCGEFGDSTDGTHVDGNWQEVLAANYKNSGFGYAQWFANWAGSGATGDNLWTPGQEGRPTGLSSGGQALKAAIAAGL